MTSNLFKRFITSIFLIFLFLFGLFYNNYTWNILVIFFLLLCLYEFYKIINKIYRNKIFKIILILFIFFYLYFFYILLINIRLKFGEETILILIIACIFSDLGGYFVGKLIGGPKLTKISPNKTISGAFGSILFTVLGTYFYLFFLNKFGSEPISLKFSIKNFIWLILMSVYCQLGDLIISYLKRKAKIKDTGKILPGHGGILDRVDGILFALPFGVLTHFVLALI